MKVFFQYFSFSFSALTCGDSMYITRKSLVIKGLQKGRVTIKPPLTNQIQKVTQHPIYREDNIHRRMNCILWLHILMQPFCLSYFKLNKLYFTVQICKVSWCCISTNRAVMYYKYSNRTKKKSINPGYETLN